ncbi:MAG: precorrin-8X methylmutase [Desulfatibacillaceae bacterium]
MLPDEIEKRSFAIIEEEAGDHGFPPDQWPIVARMIHTSADFDYLATVRFHPDAVRAGLSAIRAGGPVFTDTNMALSGLRKRDLGMFGCGMRCLIADNDVMKTARETGVTRAQAAVDLAVDDMDGGIYVVGNAPTALLRLIEHVESGRARPALVVGLPVGFVNAAESKDALTALNVPHITNVGRKGGSNVAAAVVNALVIMANQAGK